MKGYTMSKIKTIDQFNAAVKLGELKGKYGPDLNQVEPDLLKSIFGELYARKCSNSGVGMNEGYLDTDQYYALEKDMLEGNRKDNPDYTIDDWENDCEENDECYWTEWEVIHDGWEDGVFTLDGTKVPNPLYPDEFEPDD